MRNTYQNLTPGRPGLHFYTCWRDFCSEDSQCQDMFVGTVKKIHGSTWILTICQVSLRIKLLQKFQTWKLSRSLALDHVKRKKHKIKWLLNRSLLAASAAPWLSTPPDLSDLCGPHEQSPGHPTRRLAETEGPAWEAAGNVVSGGAGLFKGCGVEGVVFKGTVRSSGCKWAKNGKGWKRTL